MDRRAGALRDQKRVLGLLELELQVLVVCFDVSAGNQLWILQEQKALLTTKLFFQTHEDSL